MKGLENIVREIERSAQAEAASIVAQATKEAEEIVSLSREQAQKEKQELLEETRTNTQWMISQSDSGAIQQHRQQILSTKQEILQETLEKAKKTINNLSREEYYLLLSEMAARTEGKGPVRLQMNQRDLEDVPESFLKSFPSDLEIVLEEIPAEITGGFILNFGNVYDNLSIDSIFERNHNKIYDILREILFQ